jgi:hypothetical protein
MRQPQWTSIRQSLLELRRNPMPICVATEPELEIEIPSKTRAFISSQYPLGTIFTVHSSRDGGCDETHRINSVVAVAKARQFEASGYQVRITDRRGRQFAPSEFDELLHSKPRASLSARDFIPA